MVQEIKLLVRTNHHKTLLRTSSSSNRIAPCLEGAIAPDKFDLFGIELVILRMRLNRAMTVYFCHSSLQELRRTKGSK